MGQNVIRLPIRILAAPAQRNGLPWVCKRCLATQTISAAQRSMPPDIPTKKPASEAENYDPHVPTAQRDYRLTTTDFYLKKALPQRLPDQHLLYSTSDLLQETEARQREFLQSRKQPKKQIAVVVSAGKMDKTVKVKVPGRRWNKKIHKVPKLLLQWPLTFC
jgi:hypothetical protein